MTPPPEGNCPDPGEGLKQPGPGAAVVQAGPIPATQGPGGLNTGCSEGTTHVLRQQEAALRGGVIQWRLYPAGGGQGPSTLGQGERNRRQVSFQSAVPGHGCLSTSKRAVVHMLSSWLHDSQGGGNSMQAGMAPVTWGKLCVSTSGATGSSPGNSISFPCPKWTVAAI